MAIIEENSSVDIFEDDINEEIEVKLEDDGEEVSGHMLPLGIALNDSELYRLSTRKKIKLIYVLGPVDSGKTTFEAMLYAHFLKKIDDEILFSGSETLVGFEDRLNSLRTKSGTSDVDMPRTPKDERRTYLHLEVYDKGLKEKFSIVLSDTSGEAFEESKSNVAYLQQKLPYLDMAERVVLFLDGKSLIDNTLRHNAVNKLKMLLRTIKSSNLCKSGLKVDIIISKNDCIFEKKDDENAKSFIDNIPNNFAEFKESYDIKFYRIEAINDFKITDVNNSTPLIDLIKHWIKEERFNSCEFSELEENTATFINEFNKYGGRY